ncbi:MAG: magnesium/cobalt transporter CorA [Candidatus Kapabacteria bacterium]|jgi:magnesium transporter|nr:magnesium/cobalt transporter CorA [Candidatus Kapabacteria bacterium]
MARIFKKHKHEIGLPPDELFFRGKQKIENVLLRVIEYNPDKYEAASIDNVKDVLNFSDPDSVTWLNIDGLHDLEIMKDVSEELSFDQLIIAEVMNTQGRPRITEYDNCLYVCIKMLQKNDENSRIAVENLSIILTKTGLITFQEVKGDVFDPVRERIKKSKRKLKKSGPDYLMFALLDIVVDNYLYNISLLGEKIDLLEERMLKDANQSLAEEINTYKRDLIFLRKTINPAKEMIIQLSKLETDLLDDSTDIHLKELVDNINQAYETAESYREILSDQLNIFHMTMSSKLNDIMKFLTVFSVIFIPLTFIAGIYGTNFDVLPELHYKYSYFIMLGLMLSLALGMMVYFRRKKWL